MSFSLSFNFAYFYLKKNKMIILKKALLTQLCGFQVNTCLRKYQCVVTGLPEPEGPQVSYQCVDAHVGGHHKESGH